MEESGFLCPSYTSTFFLLSVSLISFHGMNLVTVPDRVLFVVGSSWRESRELSNQGTVEGTAMMC